jgi:hypothetical protein
VPTQVRDPLKTISFYADSAEAQIGGQGEAARFMEHENSPRNGAKSIGPFDYLLCAIAFFLLGTAFMPGLFTVILPAGK